MTFGGEGVKDPAAAARAWKANIKALPNIVFVSGIGDGAVFSQASSRFTVLNFISNGVTCNIYTANFLSDRSHLGKLAEFIIAG